MGTVNELLPHLWQKGRVAPPEGVEPLDDGATVLCPYTAHRVAEAEAGATPLRRACLESLLEAARHKFQELGECLHGELVKEEYLLSGVVWHVVSLWVRLPPPLQGVPFAGCAGPLGRLFDEFAQPVEQGKPPVGPPLAVRVRQGLVAA